MATQGWTSRPHQARMVRKQNLQHDGAGDPLPFSPLLSACKLGGKAVKTMALDDEDLKPMWEQIAAMK